MDELRLRQTIIRKLETLGQERLTFLNDFIDRLDGHMQPKENRASHVAATSSYGSEKEDLIRSLKGKYVRVALSSDEFAHRKQAEIERENRVR